MSIYSAMSSALSGLNAASRSADVISSNIANAMTEGYGTRRLDQSARITGNDGSGVRVNGITRQVDTVLVGQRREAEAGMNARQVEAAFMSRLEAMIGAPDTPGSLSSQFAEFEASLITAANAPWNTTHLSNAVDNAQSVASALNTLSSQVQDERLRADGEIERSVGTINSALESLADLNGDILSAASTGGEVASLLDAQARLLDQIAPFIPMQTRRGDNGTLQVYSNDGHVLLDSRAAQIGFSPTRGMDPYLSVADGDLSALTINGRPLAVDGPAPAFEGGQLQALFQVRDTFGPDAQAQLDAIARDLVGRFDATGLDPTLLAGDAGLFTDLGAQAVPANELGLAARLRVNDAVVPEQGGAVWRLRDGIGAAVEGPSGNATLLTGLIEAMGQSQTTASGAYAGGIRSMSGLVSETLSYVGLSRNSAENGLSQSSARFTALEASELAGGVDTDDELQRLLKIEQMYSANARVISVAGELLDELMRITQ